MPTRDIEILTALQRGKVTVRGEFVWGSNYTFLAQVVLAGLAFPAVYKPTRGERRLWDFPAASLAHREVAAYLVSEALGWQLVPPTVYRVKAPIGPGSLQFFVEHDQEYHYFNFTAADRQRLRPVVLLDLLINNADRKGSHVLVGPDGHLWLIDHGICFHVEDKLRTVIWDFVDEPIPGELLTDLQRFRQELGPQAGEPSSLVVALQAHLSPGEITALGRRASELLATKTFPAPDPDRRFYPWPQL